MVSISLVCAQEAAVNQIAPLSENNRTIVTSANLKASSLIGMTVRNDAGERLGKIQDIIVNMDSRSAPFAILERGGALGIGGTRVAVPLADFKWSSAQGQLTLATTREQLDSASTSPLGGWMAMAGEGWMKNVDRYYGEPSAINEPVHPELRQVAAAIAGGEPGANSEVNLKAPNGQPEQALADPALPHQVATPTDEYLMGKINGVIHQDIGEAASRDVQVTLKEGLVTLKGKVPSEAQRKLVENQIKVIGGIDRVQNDLSVSNSGY